MSVQRLRDLIRRIGPPGRLAWGVAVSGEAELFPEESLAVLRAVPRRRAEFAAGRLAARRAMAKLGAPATEIPAGPDRAPVWPQGIVGSISHSDGLCVAVVGFAHDVEALGVDIEADAPLDPALIPEICLSEELETLPEAARPAQARRVFSAKEAAYKAHYPRARRIFGFHALSVDLPGGRARFTDHPEVAAIPPESRNELNLRQVVGGGLILSLSLTRAEARSH